MKVKNIFTVTVPVLMLTVLLGSCIRENIIYVDDVTSRTVFVYMAADNNLNGYVDDNINQMKMSVSKMPYKANLIVYVDRLKAKPMLLNVKFEKIDTIKVFPELNSSSADTFEMIFREVKHRWPADKYGLLMWSHGTGWIP
ncbi:MAG TPA: clostripain-related cysteine peptidase, partial [Bacteroidaceae bacterium]|nr:clostripain-related cysteine peptidase [Bacteroidaceae bacterium]